MLKDDEAPRTTEGFDSPGPRKIVQATAGRKRIPPPLNTAKPVTDNKAVIDNEPAAS